VTRVGARGPVLGLRELNRATLERQMLLRRANLPVPEAVEALVGLQAQTTHSWYVGLWTRLEGLDPEAVGGMLEERRLVRVALMRSTIHLVTAEDCVALRPLVQPAIERGVRGQFGRRLEGLEREEVAAAARALVEEQPRAFSELARLLDERFPGRDAFAMGQAVRAWVPLVQVPPRGVWGKSGRALHTSVEAWLSRVPSSDASLEDLVLRYLAAFGPATVKDAQTWSGLTRLREVTDKLRPHLVTFRDEHGAELFDLPDAPRPDPDTPAPPRFLYDYDNLLLSHADRSRVITGGYHEQGFAMDGPMPSVVLLDGFTGATWKVTRHRGTATLTVRPFERLSDKDTRALTEEGARLLAFVAADADAHDVRFAPAE
jgi:Winged helix DNA-binding domain